MSVHWVACGTCYTKTEGTELGGIELQRSSFSSGGGGGGGHSLRPFEGTPRRRDSRGPLTHTFNYFVMSCRPILRSFSFLCFGNKLISRITKHALYE